MHRFTIKCALVAMISMAPVVNAATYTVRLCQTEGQACNTCKPDNESKEEITPLIDKSNNVVILNISYTENGFKKKESDTLENCKIIDKNNWSCILPASSDYIGSALVSHPEHGYKMIDGNLVRVPFRTTFTHWIGNKAISSDMPTGVMTCYSKKSFWPW